jgi:hypothetical protein
MPWGQGGLPEVKPPRFFESRVRAQKRDSPAYVGGPARYSAPAQRLDEADGRCAGSVQDFGSPPPILKTEVGVLLVLGASG